MITAFEIASFINENNLIGVGADRNSIKKQASFIEGHLQEDEKLIVAAFTKANFGGKKHPGVGVFVMTDQRFLFGYKYLLGKAFFEAPLENASPLSCDGSTISILTDIGSISLDFSCGMIATNDEAIEAINEAKNRFFDACKRAYPGIAGENETVEETQNIQESPAKTEQNGSGESKYLTMLKEGQLTEEEYLLLIQKKMPVKTTVHEPVREPKAKQSISSGTFAWVFSAIGLLLVLAQFMVWLLVPYMVTYTQLGRTNLMYFDVLGGAAGPKPTGMFIMFLVLTIVALVYFVLLIIKKPNHGLKLALNLVGMLSAILSLVLYLTWIYGSGVLSNAYMTIAGDVAFDVIDGILIAVFLASSITEIIYLKK